MARKKIVLTADNKLMNENEVVSRKLDCLVGRIFGVPIWTQDHDGECRKRTLRKTSGGVLMTKKIIGSIVVNSDGTVPHGYVEKWWVR